MTDKINTNIVKVVMVVSTWRVSYPNIIMTNFRLEVKCDYMLFRYMDHDSSNLKCFWLNDKYQADAGNHDDVCNADISYDISYITVNKQMPK